MKRNREENNEKRGDAVGRNEEREKIRRENS